MIQRMGNTSYQNHGNGHVHHVETQRFLSDLQGSQVWKQEGVFHDAHQEAQVLSVTEKQTVFQ